MATANEWAPDADVKLTRATMELFKGTSVTSNTIADTGSLTFTTQTYLYFDEGKWLEFIDNANSSNWMAGQVTSYNKLTGALVFAPKVKSGSGTIADWLIYSSGVWIANPWNGGTVTNPVTISNTLAVTGTSTLARVNASAPITSTAGDVNLSTTTALSDASQTLTAAQIFNGTLTISPTAARILTLPTAAAIIAYMSGYVVGSNFRFTLVNTTTQSVTIAAGAGITQLGKTLLTDGSAVFKVVIDSATVATVINESVFTPAAAASPAGVITSSQTRSSAVDLTLTATSPGLQLVTMTAEGKYVILPDATTLSVASPSFVIYNKGYSIFGIKDGSGALIASVESGGEITLSLADKTTVAGVWTRTGTGICAGYMDTSAVMSGNYTHAQSSDMVYVALTSSISIHFVENTGGGFSAVLLNSASQVVGTPSSVTTTASSKAKAVFRIDDSTAIVFYSNATNRLYASLLLISSPLIVVTAAVDTGVITGISVEDGMGAPKVVQLDTNLYLISYATATGAGTTSVKGCQISSGTTITFGAAVDLATADNCINSTVSVPLTTTTALVLYKTGAAAPYTGKARVVTVSNANPPVCTLGAEVSHLTSSQVAAPSCAALSATLAYVIDGDNAATTTNGVSLAISGTTVTVGTPIDTTLNVGASEYAIFEGTRFNGHVTRLTDSTALLWGKITATGKSALIAISVSAGVTTLGNKVLSSFSDGASLAPGEGLITSIGATEFLGIKAVFSSGSSYQHHKDFLVIPHKISGTTVTVGKGVKATDLFGSAGDPDSGEVVTARLANGTYAIVDYGYPTVELSSIVLVRTDGTSVAFLGSVPVYGSGATGVYSKFLPTNGNRVINVARELPSTANQMRLSSILVNPTV